LIIILLLAGLNGINSKSLYQSELLTEHFARIKRFRDKALIEENGYSLVKINNAVYKPFKLALWELSSKLITSQIE